MITHPPHIEHAKWALAYFDAAPTGAEIGRRGVKVASALRVLLYEPKDGYQGTTMHEQGVTRYRCAECDYRCVTAGHPPITTCPRCRGDFTWAPIDDAGELKE